MCNWTLYEGDCLDILPAMPRQSVDAIITDPPYSSGGLHKAARSRDPVKKYVRAGAYLTFSGDHMDQRSWQFWMLLWLRHAVRLLKPGGRFYMFIDWRQLPSATDLVQAAGITWRGIIPWDKGRGTRAPHTGYHRHQCEYVIFGTLGDIGRADGRGPFDGCLRCSVPSKKLHPTEKPVAILRELVRAVPPGGVVLDPFAGSGSTLVAAVSEGYKVIGIEREPEYCEIIRKRMAELQPALPLVK
jgi:site-specific DNA-methyltransferase (adenine-specific)